MGHPLCDSLGSPLQAAVGGPSGRPDCVVGFGHLQKPRAAHLLSWIRLFGAAPVRLLQAPLRSTCFRCIGHQSPRRRWPPSTRNKCFLLTGPSLKLAGEAEAQQGSWAQPGQPSWLGRWSPKLRHLFPSLCSTQCSPTVSPSSFPPCPAWWVRPRDPALDPCLSIGCLQVEGGPELQVAWVAWAEMIEVPVASNPTCFNVLGNPSIPFPKGTGSFALEGLYYQSNQQKVSMLVSP